MASNFTHPKEKELAESRRLANDETVPSYGNHTTDSIYTDQVANYGTGLPSEEDELDPQEEAHQPQLPLRETSPEPPTPTGPLSLTLDKDLIFPNTIPATALYSLNFTLNSMGNSIMVRRSGASPRGKIVDKDLYGITRQPMSGSHLFEIQGKRQSTFPGTGKIQFKSGLFGGGWECQYKNKLVLKGKRDIWTNVDGKVVAREVNEVPEGNKKGVQGKPILNFEKGIDELLVDLMVAVWCTTIWASGTYEAREMKHTESKSH